MIVNAYVGGHAFEVKCEYTPEIVGGLEEPFEDEELEITKIFLGEYNINQLINEEAPDLFDKIAAQAMTRIKEGMKDER